MANKRKTPIEINKEDFRKMGYTLIDQISDFMDTIDNKVVTPVETPKQLQQLLGDLSLPDKGTAPEKLLTKATDLLFDHSLLNGHPKFFGYITSSAAPIGALADMLAASVNPNVGAHILSPMATEIEKQTIKWLAELIGVSPTYGGILVSGGNMANFTAFLAARTEKAPETIKEDGIGSVSKLIVYCSKTTHTWVEKATILFGHGSKSIRWIATDSENKMDNTVLENAIKKDLNAGYRPFMVVGTAGDVSTGVVDNLTEIAAICENYNLWFHIDGAYGAPAAVIPDLKKMFEGIAAADSIALDPHKWLYAPLEAGCTLVKDPNHLIATYSSHPEYYNFDSDKDDIALNYYEYGFQNSRGFRALKVWMTLQQIGKNGYIDIIGEDIELSKLLYKLADNHRELEAVTQNLSITTFRYVPENFSKDEAYLNTLNESLVNQLQQGGEMFLSNAIINDAYCLRACIVNFRTSKKDIEEVIEIVVKEGDKLHQKLQK